MPKYTVKEKSLIGNTIYEAGDVVDYDGLPADNLIPMDAEGEAKAAEYVTSNAERVAKMRDQYADSTVGGDPAAFAKAVKDAITEAHATHTSTLSETIAAAVASAIALVFPNGTAKKAADPANPIA